MKRRSKYRLLDPARTVIERVGGISAAAEATGCDFSSVYRWMRSREDGGTGGIIPAPHQLRLLEYSKAKNGALKPDDFFCAA